MKKLVKIEFPSISTPRTLGITNGADPGVGGVHPPPVLFFVGPKNSGQVNFNPIFGPHLPFYSGQIETEAIFCGFFANWGRSKERSLASRSIYLEDRGGFGASYIFL